MATVAVLGCGLLGSGFVENLRTKGESVQVWNRTASRASALAALGAVPASTPAEAVRGADRVHLVLTADEAVDEVLAAALPALGAGVPVLDHSTNLPALVRTRYTRLRADGVAYTHVPVFMGPANARAASGIMMIGGPAAEVEPLLPLLNPMTGRVWVVGEGVETAAVYKLMGNSVIISALGVLGDCLALGEAGGIDAAGAQKLFEVFNLGGYFPTAMARVAKRGDMAASFELAMARKDVRLMLDHAGGPEGLVVLPAVAAAMDEALAAGLGQKDYSTYAWPRARG